MLDFGSRTDRSQRVASVADAHGFGKSENLDKHSTSVCETDRTSSEDGMLVVSGALLSRLQKPPDGYCGYFFNIWQWFRLHQAYSTMRYDES